MTKKEIVETLDQLYNEIEKGTDMYVYINSIMFTTHFGENARMKVKKPCADDSMYWFFMFSGYGVTAAVMSADIHDIKIEVVEK